MVRLSICIATLNRGRFLKETLDCLLAQCSDAVEFVIVDGASTDDTPDVITSRFQARTNSRSIRLESKGGVDRDYCRAVAEASGEYCWLFTDDDLVEPDTVATILREIEAGPDLVVLNVDVWNADYSQLLIPRKIAIDADRTVPPGDTSQLLATAGEMLSFIGSVVIKKSVWDERQKDRYFGTEFVHFGVIFQRPLAGFARVIARPLVHIRYGNSQWAARAFEIWLIKWPALVWSADGATDAAKTSVTPREPWRRTDQLAMMKARGCYTWREYRTHLSPRPLGFLTRVRLAAIAIFPNVLYNALWHLLLRFVSVPDKALPLELANSPYNFRKRWFRQ